MLKKTAAIIGVGALVTTGLSVALIQSAQASSVAPPTGCWITVDLDSYVPNSGAPDPAQAINRRLTDARELAALEKTGSAVQTVLADSLSRAITLEDAVRVTGLEVPTESSRPDYVSLDALGAVTGTFQVEEIEPNRWMVTRQQVKLPAGTDCSKNQLF